MKSFCKIITNLLFISFLLEFASPVFAYWQHPCIGRTDEQEKCIKWFNNCKNNETPRSCLDTLNMDYPLLKPLKKSTTVETHPCQDRQNSDKCVEEFENCMNHDIRDHHVCKGIVEASYQLDGPPKTGAFETTKEGTEIVTTGEMSRLPAAVEGAINDCDKTPTTPDCTCLLDKADNADLTSANTWLNECSTSQVAEHNLNPSVTEIPKNGTEAAAAAETTEEKKAVAEEASEKPRKVASSPNSGGLSCDSPTLNNYCSMASQDSPTVIPGEAKLEELISPDSAPVVDDLVEPDPSDNAQFACRESLEHEKSGAEFVCENPVKALGGPAAQAVRAIGQYGAPIVGASGLLMKNNESINKLCTTIAMLSATGVAIGVAARRKCSGKIKKCQQTCETEKTQECEKYNIKRAQCLKAEQLLRTSQLLAPAVDTLQQKLNTLKAKIDDSQQKVEEIESVKRRCKKLEANIASMGQDILNLVMTLGSAKVCRDATGGKYTTDIENCEERGGTVVTDPLGNMICDEPEKKCTTTSECPDKEMCRNGICHPITGICLPEGIVKACTETCDNGQPPSNCPIDPDICPDPSLTYPDCNCDCPTGQSCNSDQQCVRPVCADGSNYPCECNNCPTGQSCNSDQQCVRPVCADGSNYPCECNNCPTGQSCNSDQQCVRPDVCPDPSLTYPDCNCDCPPNQSCNSDQQCVPDNDGKGNCPDGSRVACDQDCSDGSRPTNCRSCNSNSNCEENQICNRGVCITEDPVLSQDGAGGGGTPTDGMESEMAITNDGMGGGDGNQRKPSGNPLSGMELPGAAEMGGSGTAGGLGAGGGSSGGGGGGFFSGLFGGGRKAKSKGKGIMEDESGATIKGSGGGGFGGYGGGGRKGRGKLALSKKQIKKLKKEKGAQRTLSKMKEGFGGAHHDIFERITKRFTHLCKNKMNCR